MAPPRFWFRPPGLASAALAPAAAIVTAVGRFRRGRARPHRAAVPVICVGNLVVGGAGKTPTVLAICDRLAARGYAPAILSRGYGGTERGPHRVDPERDTAARVGDEPLAMAARRVVWIGADRAASADAAVADGAEVLVMDDGFQNPGLAKDLALIVVDAGVGHGNARVMPAGPLREPLDEGFARADAMIVIGRPPAGAASSAWPYAPADLPVLRARLAPRLRQRPLAGRRVFAFAGIGRPEKFFETLAETGAKIVGTAAFPDHHPYSAAILARLESEARRLGAELITTEKDAVRLPRAMRARVETLEVALGFEDASALEALLDRVAPPLA